MPSDRFRRFSALAPVSAMAAALVMAVGMGFGRFAFTGVYPVMVREAVVSISQGTWAASANYAGYLIGALWASRVQPVNSHRLSVLAVFAIALLLAALSWVQAPWLIIVIRGLTGAVSALAMVAASSWLLRHRGYHRGAPVLFAGVGVGILLSSELLVAGQTLGLRSYGLWLMLAVAAAMLGALALPALTAPAAPAAADAPRADVASAARQIGPSLSANRLIGLYGLAGFGYVITATYLPLLMKDALGSANPIHAWALFGLGAIPSCFIWHAAHVRLGTRGALVFNLLIQAIGVVLPVVSPTSAGYLGSALLVGGTFMGTTTIAMLAAGRLASAVGYSILAAMTAAFGVGQIVGPLVASTLYARTGSFSASLAVAGAALVVAACFCIGRKQSGPSH